MRASRCAQALWPAASRIRVLPDFNYGIGKAALRAVLPQAIALELPRIGLIVADDEIALGIETVEQRSGQARIAIPQDANVPRPWSAPSSSP